VQITASRTLVKCRIRCVLGKKQSRTFRKDDFHFFGFVSFSRPYQEILERKILEKNSKEMYIMYFFSE